MNPQLLKHTQVISAPATTNQHKYLRQLRLLIKIPNRPNNLIRCNLTLHLNVCHIDFHAAPSIIQYRNKVSVAGRARTTDDPNMLRQLRKWSFTL